jgi:hypothetical protein
VGGVLPGAACVGALVDRYTQHLHVLDNLGRVVRQSLQGERGEDTSSHTGTWRREEVSPPACRVASPGSDLGRQFSWRSHGRLELKKRIGIRAQRN